MKFLTNICVILGLALLLLRLSCSFIYQVILDCILDQIRSNFGLYLDVVIIHCRFGFYYCLPKITDVFILLNLARMKMQTLFSLRWVTAEICVLLALGWLLALYFTHAWFRCQQRCGLCLFIEFGSSSSLALFRRQKLWKTQSFYFIL